MTTPPLKGLGATVDLLHRIVSADVEALDLLDRALQNPHGGDRRSADFKSDNAALETDDQRSSGQRGTSKDYALRRLRKDAPALHAEVIAGHRREVGTEPGETDIRYLPLRALRHLDRFRHFPKMILICGFSLNECERGIGLLDHLGERLLTCAPAGPRAPETLRVSAKFRSARSVPV